MNKLLDFNKDDPDDPDAAVGVTLPPDIKLLSMLESPPFCIAIGNKKTYFNSIPPVRGIRLDMLQLVLMVP